MGEIKSTLDLVMERTRNMVSTDAEKEAHRAREIRNRARGLVLKLEDSQIGPEELERAIDEAGAGEAPELRDGVVRALVESLDPEQDPAVFLAGLEMLADDKLAAAVTAAREALQDHARRREEEMNAARAAGLERLAAQGISGSAVIPVLPEDPDLERRLQSIRAGADDALARLRRAAGIA